jgi:bifunctional DNase/RNase
MHEMTVYGVSFDLVGKQPIVLLRAAEGSMYLPIWIGHPEAAAILMRLQGQEPPRPLTHDLALSLVESLDAEVDRVTVTELKDGTFYARITLVRDGTEIEIDSRPSDAIALAIRADAKIFAEDEVMDESGVVWEGDVPDLAYAQDAQELGEVDLGEFRKFLDTVTPDEFAAGSDDPPSS